MPSTAGAIRAGRAFVELFADDSKLVRGLRRAQKRLQGFGSFLGGIGARLVGTAATLATPFLGAVKAASDLEETMNKFNVVFGDSAETMKAWSDTTADELGRSKRQIAEFVSGSQDLLVPLGIDPAVAREASKTLTRLSVDLASFNNKADADVMRDIQAALTGSSETMKKYGVVANETAVKQELLNEGINPKNATEAQKAMARLNIIIRGTTAAQGDAVRSGGSFANMWKRVKAKMEDAAGAVGAALLPTLAEMLGKVATALVKFGEWASQNQTLIATIAKIVGIVAAVGAGLLAAGAVASALGSIIGLVATGFTALSSILGVVIGLFSFLASPIGIVIGLAAALSAFFLDWGGIMESVTGTAADEFEGFKDRALNAWGGIRDAIAAGDLSLAFKIVTLALKAEWLRIVSIFKAKWNEWIGFFQSIWTNAVFGAARIITNAWAGIQSFWYNLTDGLADAWSTFTGFIQKTWNSTVGFLKKAWEKLKSSVTGKRGRSSSDIDRETARANAEVDRKRNAAISARERERRQRLAGIEQERRGTIDALNEEQARREQARADADAAELAENDRKLQEAKDELAKAIEEAKKKRKESEKDSDDAKKNPSDQIRGVDLAKLAGAGSGLSKKAEVEGTRSAFDRFGGGGRSSESADRKQMIASLKKIEQNTRELTEQSPGVPLL